MSAFSANRRRILSLWLPRLPIDRIKRLHSVRKRISTLSHDRASLSRLRGGLGWECRRIALGCDDSPQRRRRQAKQRAADLCPRRSGRARRPLDRPAARQCPRHLSRVDGVRCRRGRRPQDARRHRRLVRPLHAAGGARSAAWAVSRHHRLRPSVRRRTRAAADGERRAGTAGLCRQRRDRLDLDLRPHADAAAFAEKSLPMARRPLAVGPLPVSALGAERCHHRRPAPRRLENHRRRRLARAATKSRRGSAPASPRCWSRRWGRAMRRSARESRCRITSSKNAFPNRSPPKT